MTGLLIIDHGKRSAGNPNLHYFLGKPYVHGGLSTQTGEEVPKGNHKDG